MRGQMSERTTAGTWMGWTEWIGALLERTRLTAKVEIIAKAGISNGGGVELVRAGI